MSSPFTYKTIRELSIEHPEPSIIRTVAGDEMQIPSFGRAMLEMRVHVGANEGLKADHLHSFDNLVDRFFSQDFTNPENLPAFVEEEYMSFKRKGIRLPDKIKDLDYDQLHNTQVWVLADWMGARRAVVQLQSEAARRAELKRHCEMDLDRAQKGYNVICRGEMPDSAGKPSNDVEKRALELVMSWVKGHEEGIDNKAELAVRTRVASIIDQLDGLARKAIRDAAEHAKPLLIKEGGKAVRKVKGILPPEFKRMVELASARIPIMLVGPAGCGKTYLAEKLGEALDMEVSDQSCSEGMSESVFNGLLLPVGKGGMFEHVTSPFMDRYEKGGVMLLDEIDAGDPNLFTYINKAIANQSYSVSQRWTKPVVKKHKDFVLVAAANTFGHGADAMYVGRNQLDAATLDRFKVGLICIDYDKQVEESLGTSSLCDWAWKIRAAIRQHKLRRVMSTRVIKDLSTMTEMYKWKQPEWEAAYFAGWSDADRKMVAPGKSTLDVSSVGLDITGDEDPDEVEV